MGVAEGIILQKDIRNISKLKDYLNVTKTKTIWPAKMLETLNLARGHQLHADP